MNIVNYHLAKINNTMDTRFRIASISKKFTSISILKLIEEEKINLDTRDLIVDIPTLGT